MDKKTLLSTLWIFLTVNFIFCDVFTLMNSEDLKNLLKGIKYFAHEGGSGGYYCEIRIYPDIKRGSVIFFNRSGMSDERYLDKLDKFQIENAGR